MLRGAHIVLVEDDEIMGASLLQRMQLEGAEVVWYKQAQRALGAIRTPRGPIDAVICDIRLPDGTGEELYNTLCMTTSPPPFLFITGHGGIDQAVRLIKAGAADYVTKPFEIAVFLERLAMLLSQKPKGGMPPLLGVSKAAQRVDELALKAAETDRPVLIVGGPGTGKELVARRIHQASDRQAAPFVAVNLARESDPENVLFGKGGAWENVGEGVLFLNALSRLPEATQLALLDAMQAGFGGRIIGACGQEMTGVIANNDARADFFYRLNMMEILVPPLGQRPEDAVWLMQQLFPPMNADRKWPLNGISSLCIEAVRTYDWPGGGRELRARLQRGIENAGGDLLQPLDVFPETLIQSGKGQSLAEARDAAEKARIIDALSQTDGKISKAARILKVSRTTLWDKMQKLEIEGKPRQ